MLKSKMSDGVLMVDVPGYLAQRFHIRRELKSIISCPPGAPRRRRELPAIAVFPGGDRRLPLHQATVAFRQSALHINDLDTLSGNS